MKKLLCILLSLATLLLCGCGGIEVTIVDDTDETTTVQTTTKKTTTKKTTAKSTKSSTVKSGSVKVHYIDVGQADAIFIETKDGNMLIDGGNNDDGDLVVNYLKNLKVDTIDYVVGTHPHEDHIGGLDVAIKAFNVKNVLMPKVTYNTKTYEDVLYAVKKKGLKVTAAKAGQKFTIGDAKFQVFSPIKTEYYDMNEYSVVIRMDYKNSSFLFTGDAEIYNETEMMNKGYNVDVDVLKVGHHGSSTSSSQKFLNAVSPKIAVIQVGKNNDYGHPHKEIKTRLKNIETYRTDTNGNIVIETDGTKYKVTTQK